LGCWGSNKRKRGEERAEAERVLFDQAPDRERDGWNQHYFRTQNKKRAESMESSFAGGKGDGVGGLVGGVWFTTPSKSQKADLKQEMSAWPQTITRVLSLAAKSSEKKKNEQVLLHDSRRGKTWVNWGGGSPIVYRPRGIS